MTRAVTAGAREQFVAAAKKRVFEVCTAGFGHFQPREHDLMPSPIASTAFERRVGGHILADAEDGGLCRRARIRTFRPHDRLVYSWIIGPDWERVPDPDNVGEVEMRLIAGSPQRPRAAHEHRHLDRHGPGWAAPRDGVADDGGWPLHIDQYGASLGEGH